MDVILRSVVTSRTKDLVSYAVFDEAHARSAALSGKDSALPTNRFVLSHELSRGAMAGLQSALHYVLMLVVMTFSAAFIISVILGVVVGETAFGRLNSH
ncbi:hypothetical protein FB451DRAFT_1437502 [Mycena latifolia]|nr:hypothetical protein FB451DRAFT_1437502 [Mycena latifolia]